MPEISIVIPMHNAEKYIGDCLESISAQTFQDFEIIVVDDCSTDKSRAEVEKYSGKFGERIKLVNLQKSSDGCAGVPRNIGLQFSRGKYICFVDSDDAITSTALEELYNLAEKFQADVVQCDKHYSTDTQHFTTDKKFLLQRSLMTKEQLVEVPTLESENLSDRVKDLQDFKIWWTVWGKLFRRDFLILNKIKFEKLQTSEDFLFVFQCLCLSKNYLRVPNVVYIWREHSESHSRQHSDLQKYIRNWVTPMLSGTEFIEKFMKEIALFSENAVYRNIVLNSFMQIHFKRLEIIYENVPLAQVEKIIFPIFEKFGNNPTLTMLFFNLMNIYRLNFFQLKRQQAGELAADSRHF